MARNSEKRLSGLNRFLEAKETKKNAELQRPPLSRLTSAEDVKGWIPSIEKEISYLLKQIGGTGSRKHNDAKIEEFQERIDHLKKEHKRFVAKVRSLDPSYRDVVPWQPRGYRRKRGREGQTTALATEAKGPQVKRLFSPLLEQEEQKPAPSSTSQEFHFHAEGSLREQPSHGSWSQWARKETTAKRFDSDSLIQNRISNEGVMKGPSLGGGQYTGEHATKRLNSETFGQAESHCNKGVMKGSPLTRGNKSGLLGLDYSSSEEEM